jgi:hypothetical protein
MVLTFFDLTQFPVIAISVLKVLKVKIKSQNNVLKSM